jgi:hypothetical protein
MEQPSMTRVTRLLVAGGLAAVLAVMMLGSALAESPPAPPSRFAGSVLVDGVAPPAGTRIEARIGSTTCGVTTTFNQGTEARYVVDVPALDPGATPNCGTDGATVTFLIGDKLARETGSWDNANLSVLNLTYVTPPTPTPSSGGGPGASVTPKVPPTGNGGPLNHDSGSDFSLLFVVLGLGAAAFGAAGVAVARKSR